MTARISQICAADVSVRSQLTAVAPDKPFFLYYAPGACHAPHHAPRDWIEKFKGRFDAGYEAIREQTLARQKEMGIVSLYHADRKVGEMQIKTQLGAFAVAGAGLYVGRHNGEPVTDDYPASPPTPSPAAPSTG